VSAAAPFEFPPGNAGALAEFIYYSSRRPVKEIATAATLATLAGVLGRAYTISDTGLNLYILLIASTGAGKETLHEGPALLLSQVEGKFLGASDFFHFGDFGSGQALTKHVGQFPCFVQVCGEFGRKLKSMAADKDGSPTQMLRTSMTNLYSKSGRHGRSGKINYSNAENNTAEAREPCYSFAGETTPGTFYELLTTNMMTDGFLPRFNIVEYLGERVAQNHDIDTVMDPTLLETWTNLVGKAMLYRTGINTPPRTEVLMGDDNAHDNVVGKFAAFDTECDLKINSSTDEGVKALWNRAHLKALRIAALLAVADNLHAPMVRIEHAAWAITQVRREIESFLRRLNSGDVGNGDDTRVKLMLSAIADYMDPEKSLAKSYTFPRSLKSVGIVPHYFLFNRLQKKAPFADHKLGLKRALDDTIRILISSSYLVPVQKADLADDHGYQGDAYRIVQSPVAPE